MDRVSYVLLGLLLTSLALFAIGLPVGLIGAVFIGCLGQMIVVFDRAYRSGR